MLSVVVRVGGSHDMLGDLVDSAHMVIVDSNLMVGDFGVH